MNPLVKHIAERAKLKMESATSLTDTPVMQLPATVVVQMAKDIELRENRIVELSLQNSEISLRAAAAERRVNALVALAKHYNIPANEIKEQMDGAK